MTSALENKGRVETAEGCLFDIYHIEEKISVLILDKDRNPVMFTDTFFPVIYLEGPINLIRSAVKRLYELDAVKDKPEWTTRTRFYENREVNVLKIIISRPSVLRKILKKLYALYGKMDIYHTDIEIPTGYMFSKGIFPLGKIRINYIENFNHKQILSVEALDDIENYDYELPDFRIMNMSLKYNHRLGLSEENPLILNCGAHYYEIPFSHPKERLFELNEILLREDPDIILSNYGDQAIFPALFHLAQSFKVNLHFDRDRIPLITRKIITKGTSYNTYGNMIYRAPSYPLFGRWHIDSSNSFAYKETQLFGTIELARISRLPVQRLARSSTGAALTAIETDVAIRRGYLVPWQKSKVESKKTFSELLKVDKGGLIFQPDTKESGMYENMAQLDFSQMYPSIMVLHNISPETVNCDCCRDNPDAPRVPEAGYHICVKRTGVVSEALSKILDRRKYYKEQIAESSGKRAEIIDAKQNSLKWMLVTSFGYLGYRNAKFGRIESHESVTAFGRKALLEAKDASEDSGFEFSHAITDCIFIRRKSGVYLDLPELSDLCQTIKEKTKIQMKVEGRYKWLVYQFSRSDPLLPVSNRYFGKFYSDELKMRGIASRRRDTPVFIKKFQLQILKIMSAADSILEFSDLNFKIDLLYKEYLNQLESGLVPWSELLLRKTAGKSMDEYTVENANFLSMKQLLASNIEIQPGEKIFYVVLDERSSDKSKRFITDELIKMRTKNDFLKYDKSYYGRLLFESCRQVWQNFETLRSDWLLAFK
ncbi:MAG: DNA polymerase [Leptospira sp.]|nr:DNA polymerase [Leptospira sp.]